MMSGILLSTCRLMWKRITDHWQVTIIHSLVLSNTDVTGFPCLFQFRWWSESLIKKKFIFLSDYRERLRPYTVTIFIVLAVVYDLFQPWMLVGISSPSCRLGDRFFYSFTEIKRQGFAYWNTYTYLWRWYFPIKWRLLEHYTDGYLGLPIAEKCFWIRNGCTNWLSWYVLVYLVHISMNHYFICQVTQLLPSLTGYFPILYAWTSINKT